MFKKFSQLLIVYANKRYASFVLAIVAFLESFILPILPDIILGVLVLGNPKKIWKYVVIATFFSVVGGIFGYFIGYLFYKTIGLWLIKFYGYNDILAILSSCYGRWGWLFVMIMGITPLPYKLVTIASGLFGYNIFLFVIFSLISRGLRFLMVAIILQRYSNYINLDKKIILLLVLLILVVVVVVLNFKFSYIC